jgi:hypothetical protein
MTQVQKEVAAVAETTKKVAGNLLHTLADVGSLWAVHGLRAGGMALTTSAETLGRTAQALDTLASEIEKKNAKPVAAEAPVAEAPVAEVKPVEPPAAN